MLLDQDDFEPIETRDRLIEQEQFNGELDEEEARQMRVNALISSSRELPSPLAFKVGDALAKIGVAIIVGMFIWTCILCDNSDLAWRN